MILHGMTEVAGQGHYTVKGLRALGLKADMAVLMSNPLGYPPDLDLKIDRTLYKMPLYSAKLFSFFLHAIKKYDTFHFHFARTLLPYGMDLPYLKKKKKRIFLEFHGSELRWKFNRNPEDRNTFAYLNGLEPVSERNLKKLKKLCNGVDGIILHDSELRDHLPETDTKVYYLPLRIDVDRFVPKFPDEHDGKVTIVHAPSKRAVKGTEYIIKAVENLKLKYEIEFILIENMSNDEAIKLYSSADIIVDQLLIGTYGVFACEAMALGKPVIAYVSEKMKSDFPEELPVVSSTIYEIEEKLEHLILNPELRRRIGIEGRSYVERFHDYRKVAGLAREIYKQEISDYTQLDAFRMVDSQNKE